jgi:hypothetical protein
VDWAWITGRIITATGWTFAQLNESSFCDVAELLRYWQEEPPAHVLLALRYLGASKRGKRGAPPIDEKQARSDMGQLGAMMGTPTRPMPPHLKEMIRQAEQLRTEHKGL